MRNDEETVSMWPSIWMMIVSGVGIAGIAMAAGTGGVQWSYQVFPIIMLALVFLVALLRMPPSPAITKGMDVSQAAGLYRSALNHLFRRKWILWLFAAFALMNLTGKLADTWLQAPLLRLRAEGFNRAVETSKDGRKVRLTFSQPLDRSVSQVAGSFGPRLPSGRSTGGYVLAALVLLIAVLWNRSRLRRLQREPGYASRVGFAEFAVILAATVALIVGSLAMWQTWMYFTFYLTSQTLSPGQFGGKRMMEGPVWMFSWLALSVFYCVFSAVIVAGLAGSLKRTKTGEAISVDTFLRDAVSFFQPVTGATLLLAIPGLVLFGPFTQLFYRSPIGRLVSSAGLPLSTLWTLATPLFMFTVYAIVFGELGAWAGIRRGLSDWFANVWSVISFIAFGLTILLPVHFVENVALAAFRYPWAIWVQVVSAMITTTVGALTAAFMMVAVFEFYWRLIQTKRVEELPCEAPV